MKRAIHFVSIMQLVLSIVVFPARAQKTPDFNKLTRVNEQWYSQPDTETLGLGNFAGNFNEQESIRFHLMQVERLLRSRPVAHLPEEQQGKRKANLDVLNAYWKNGVFPVNSQHQNRQPYFVDDTDIYCAVGYLMKQSGADDMARSIHATQNFNYLFDIDHPQLMKWVENSGLTLDELALIQPGYINDRPAHLLEFHYNNAGTDQGEYIEIQQPVGLMETPVTSLLFYDASGTLYKTLPASEMQSIQGEVLAYSFPPNEAFVDKGRIELRGSGVPLVKQSIEYTDTSVTVTTYSVYGGTSTVRHYSIGESENTPSGYSLTFCGHTFGFSSTPLTLQSLPSTPGTVNPCTVLPVTLTQFTHTLRHKTVNLFWETADQTNNSHFEIEWSANGREFTALGKVEAIKNSRHAKYSFTDARAGYINHYRLKQMDNDGRFSYSNILYVKVPSANPLRLQHTIAQDVLVVQVSAEARLENEISIYDFTGRLVMRLPAASGGQQVNVSRLTAGKYLVQLHGLDGQVYRASFIKQ